MNPATAMVRTAIAPTATPRTIGPTSRHAGNRLVAAAIAMMHGTQAATRDHETCDPATGYACSSCKAAIGTRKRSAMRIGGDASESRASAGRIARAGSHAPKPPYTTRPSTSRPATPNVASSCQERVQRRALSLYCRAITANTASIVSTNEIWSKRTPGAFWRLSACPNGCITTPWKSAPGDVPVASGQIDDATTVPAAAPATTHTARRGIAIVSTDSDAYVASTPTLTMTARIVVSTW